MIDYSRLREDFYNYLIGLVLFLFLPAIDDLERFDSLTDEELLKLTKEYDYDISDYVIEDTNTLKKKL